MKTFLLTILLGLLMLLLAVAGLVFTEAGQSWAIRRGLAYMDLGTEFAIEFDSAKAGLGGVTLREVRVATNGIRAEVPLLELRGNLWSAIRGERIAITQLDARDWTVDLRGVDAEELRGMLSTTVTGDSSAANEESFGLSAGFALLPSAYAQTKSDSTSEPVLHAVFKGIFPQLVLPVAVSVDGVDLTGRVLLPKRFWSEESPVMTIRVGLTGGGLRVGNQGAFKLIARADFRDEDGTPPRLSTDYESYFELDTELMAEVDEGRQFSSIAFAIRGLVGGGLIPEPLETSMEASVRRVSGGEDYALQVSVSDKRWVDVTGHYRAELGSNGVGADSEEASLTTRKGVFVGRWDIAVREEDLPVALFEGGPLQSLPPLPPFELHGEGSFETDVLFSNWHTEGQVHSNVRELDTLLESVPAELGNLSVDAEFAFQASGLGGGGIETSQERIERLRLTITSLGSAEPLLVLAAAQPFELQGGLSNSISELVVKTPESPLLSVDIPGLPLALLEPFLDGVRFESSVLSGRFEATLLNESQLRIKTVEPLQVAQLGLVLDGDLKLAELHFGMGLELEHDFDAQRSSLKVSDIELRDRMDTSLFSGELEADYCAPVDDDAASKARKSILGGGVLTATGQVRTDLGEVGKQPLLAQEQMVPETGTLTLDFTTSLAESSQSLSLLLNSQGLRMQGVALPNLEAQLGAAHDGSGTITASLPLTVRSASQQRVSDLRLEGTARLHDPTRLASGGVVSATLHGEKVFLDDLQFVVALARNSDDEEETPSVPFWEGWEGDAAVSLESVSYLGALELRGVGGKLRLGEGKLRLVDLSVGSRGSTGGLLRNLQDTLTGGLLGPRESGGKKDATSTSEGDDGARNGAPQKPLPNPLDVIGEGLRRLRGR